MADTVMREKVLTMARQLVQDKGLEVSKAIAEIGQLLGMPNDQILDLITGRKSKRRTSVDDVLEARQKMEDAERLAALKNTTFEQEVKRLQEADESRPSLSLLQDLSEARGEDLNELCEQHGYSRAEVLSAIVGENSG